MKLSTRLPLLVVPLITIPLLMAGLLAFFELKNSSQKRGEEQIHLLLARLDGQLQQMINTAGANVALLAEDPLLQKYLLTEEAEERYMLLQRPLQNSLINIQRVFPQYYEIRVLLPDGYEDLRITAGELPNQSEEEAQSATFLAMQASALATSSRIAVNPDNRQPALYVSRAIRLIDPALDSYNAQPQLRGYLSLTVSLDALIDTLTPSPWPRGGLLLSDEQGQLLAASRSLERSPLLEQVALAPITAGPPGVHRSLLGEEAYQHHAKRLAEGLWAHLLIPEDVLLSQSRRIGVLVLLICLAAIALSVPLLLVVIRNRLLRPVERLNQALASLGQQRQLVQVPLPMQNDDEISELNRSFNQMSLALYKSNERIRNLAFSDSLTGLPNRHMFIKTLRREIETARLNRGKLALLFLDLDNFKHINDTKGHPAGDQLLIKVSEILQAHLRDHDYLSRTTDHDVRHDMARLGGDEFTLLLHQANADHLAGPIAERIITALGEPIALGDSHCYVGCSIGIAIYPEDGTDVETLVKHADLAMYHAKMRGKNNYQFFSQSIAERSHQRIELDQHLHRAVETLDFHLVYQPIVDSKTLRMISAEALIRWNDPQLGLVPPDKFIPLAEENGLILPIGQWVMEAAARQVAAWRRAGLALRVGINLSSVQLSQPDIARQIGTLLDKHRLDADDLYVELTETALLQGHEQVLKNLQQLRTLGVQIALDDFGTGYSSLSYLQTLPIDILKIDRSFILDLQERNNGVILSAIITLAHSLGIKVIAEGVENHDHLSFLLSEGCDLMQGYLFSKPCSAEEIEALIRAASAEVI
ncbi:putative bifunctional diguanylate cyclase/phosphodiesterase [Pseudomonas zhanjiangensis]|uniref:Bifunctional diguanylate cyclase/phosphodiesterase n=1 Tax=Pseudomonas zhanjiangensis TaxID=3239015 RepID=A0ABV3YUD5_9PSED